MRPDVIPVGAVDNAHRIRGEVKENPAGCDPEVIATFKTLYVRDRCVLKFGKMRSGNVRNAISPYSRLDGTMRTFQDKTWETLVDAMTSLGEEIEESYGVSFNLDVSKSHPAVINN